MPDLFGQQGGQWLPSFRPGNWVSSWGARPNDFGHQTAFSYFQQNPAQMQNYNGGRLGNAFQSWFPDYLKQAQGPSYNPNTGGKTWPTQPTPQPPTNPSQGPAGGNVGGENIPIPTPPVQNPPKYGPPGTQTQPWNRPSDPYSPPQPYEPYGNVNPGTPKFPNQPDPTPYQPPYGGGGGNVLPGGYGIKNFRGGGWF